MEIAVLPVIARGAALRFLLTRLYDWLNHPEGALLKPKDPRREYLSILNFISKSPRCFNTDWIDVPRPDNCQEIYTDSACSGNPGPGGWGAILRYGENEKELSGGAARPRTNQAGTKCRDRSVTRSQTTVARADTHGQHLRKGRYNEVNRQLKPQRLADRR